MPNVRANGIDIEYDTFGDESSPPIMLIMGLAAQMIQWDEEFCTRLAERGHYVVRFDNRDAGLTTKIDDAGVPNIFKVAEAVMKGEPVSVPYTLDQMADDTVGLMDALGIDKAHICGASMGGMIAQTVALRHPDRILSLTSVMSTTGNPDLPPPKPKAAQVLVTPPPKEREAYIEYSVKINRIIGSPGFPFDDERIQKRAGRCYDRGICPRGTARQLAAIMAHGNRKEALGSVNIPTLVIHGADDPLVPVEGGRDTAESITGAELLIIDGMGHDIPRQVWPKLVDAICALTGRAK